MSWPSCSASQTKDLAPLDAATPATLVPYQYTLRARGFLVTHTT
jgi:hypothetical protein